MNVLPTIDATRPNLDGTLPAVAAGAVGLEEPQDDPLHPTEDTPLLGTSSASPSHERFHHRKQQSSLSIAVENLTEIFHDTADTVSNVMSDVKDTVVETVEHMEEAVVDTVEEVVEVLQEPVIPPDNTIKPREEGTHVQKLSATALAILVFYKVSGGPFGCETSVQAAGPLYSLLGFTIFPLLWCIPEALITAELGSAYPEPSGAIAWVEEAFGSHASLVSGYFHYVSGATDNAIYPSLFLRYLASYYNDKYGTGTVDSMDSLMMDDSIVMSTGVLSGTWIRFTAASIITIILSLINFTGLELVGNLSILVCVLSMSPFAALTLAAIPKIQPRRWLVRPTPGTIVDWRSLLNNLFWNLNSFDAGASFAGEVQDPARVFPRAMFLAVVFVVLSYLLPLLATLGASDAPQSEWSAGYFTVAATDVAGPWLGAWLLFAAAISNIALFEAEMSGDALQLLGMGDRGLIPKLFTKKSPRFGTPVNGILLGTIVILLLSVADFEELVEMLNFAYAMAFLMEFAAFVKLRISQPDIVRPYRIPLNTFGCILFVTPPTLFLVYLMVAASPLTYMYFAGMVLAGMMFHLLQKIARHYDLLEYVQALPRRGSSSALRTETI